MVLMPDEPHDDDAIQKLPEDNETPFRPATDILGQARFDDTHPNTDSDVQPEEQYDEGTAQASGAQPTVTGYTPLEDITEENEDKDD